MHRELCFHTDFYAGMVMWSYQKRQYLFWANGNMLVNLLR